MNKNLENILFGLGVVSVVALGFGIYSYAMLAINHKTLDPRIIYQEEKEWRIEERNRDYFEREIYSEQ